MAETKKQKQFLKLYEPIHDRFERFCRARVYGNMDHQDLMNETLLTAFEKFDSLKSNEAFLSFLFSIAVRILANNKKKKSEEVFSHKVSTKERQDTSANTERDMEVYLLHKAMAMLPDDQRESLILFEISGFSIKEVAAIQNVSIDAVKQRLKRGRDRLTEILTFESIHKTGEVHHG